MRFTAETELGAVEFTETIRVEDQLKILLTSEKPSQQFCVPRLRVLQSRHRCDGYARPIWGNGETEDAAKNIKFRGGSQLRINY
jgi:hypothetical protein